MSDILRKLRVKPDTIGRLYDGFINVPEYLLYHPLLPATGRHCRGGAPEAHRPDVGRLCHRGGAGRQREENPGISNSEHFSLKLSILRCRNYN